MLLWGITGKPDIKGIEFNFIKRKRDLPLSDLNLQSRPCYNNEISNTFTINNHQISMQRVGTDDKIKRMVVIMGKLT